MNLSVAALFLSTLISATAAFVVPRNAVGSTSLEAASRFENQLGTVAPTGKDVKELSATFPFHCCLSNKYSCLCIAYHRLF